MAALLIILPLLLTLSQADNGQVWDTKQYEVLQAKWTKCQFPPNGTTTDGVLKVCKEKLPSDMAAAKGIKYVCDLFQTFVGKICQAKRIEDIKKSHEKITEFLDANLDMCDTALGVRIPNSVRDVLTEKKCPDTCSGSAAEKLCGVLVLFSLTEYMTLEEAANEIAPTTNTTTNGTSTTTSNTSTDPEDTATQGQTTKAKTTKTTAPENNNPTKNPIATTIVVPMQQPVGAITYGHLVFYTVILLLILVVFFCLYKYRHTILFCLRESDGGPPSGNDGKGSYRKVPNFERVLPKTL